VYSVIKVIGLKNWTNTPESHSGGAAQSPATPVDFDQLSRLFIGMSRTRRSWEESSAARELFHALAVSLDCAAAAAHEPLQTRRRLTEGGKVTRFYREIDQASLRGPLKWRPSSKTFDILPRLLRPWVLANYVKRLTAALKGPVAYQAVADEMQAQQTQATIGASLGREPSVMTMSEVSGNVQMDGAVRIVGGLDGNIRCKSLEVAIGAHINGTIVAETVVILGSVYGRVFANHLTLGSGCQVEADLFHSALVVEADTYFEGKSRRYANPVSLVPVGWPLDPAALIATDQLDSSPVPTTSGPFPAFRALAS
jgi:cytoskeletal protein CcmA (bactofilin family)